MYMLASLHVGRASQLGQQWSAANGRRLPQAADITCWNSDREWGGRPGALALIVGPLLFLIQDKFKTRLRIQTQWRELLLVSNPQ